jgi:hypothetical protein
MYILRGERRGMPIIYPGWREELTMTISFDIDFLGDNFVEIRLAVAIVIPALEVLEPRFLLPFIRPPS